MGSKNTVGLDIYEIDLLKEKHSGARLIYVNIIGEEFVFRTLRFDEFEHMTRVCYDNKELFETACQLAVVYPEGYDFEKGLAGIPEELGKNVIEVSGFGQNGTQIIMAGFDSYREIANTSKYNAMATIIAAMPHITIDEMETWTWDKVLKYLSIAEKALAIQGNDLDMIDMSKIESEYEEEEPSGVGFLDIKHHMAGIDPVVSHGVSMTPNEYIDYPLIGSRHWEREDIVNAVRWQMEQGARQRP